MTVSWIAAAVRGGDRDALFRADAPLEAASKAQPKYGPERRPEPELVLAHCPKPIIPTGVLVKTR